MNRRRALLFGIVIVVAAAAAIWAAGASHSVVVAPGDLKWTPGAVAGVATAAVEGDMAHGASHFFLRYAAGFVTPLHHHTADHYVTLVAGTLVLSVEGKEHRLTPGSYFALTGMAPHAARCEGKEDCVMSVDARGAWDVLPEPAKQ